MAHRLLRETVIIQEPIRLIPNQQNTRGGKSSDGASGWRDFMIFFIIRKLLITAPGVSPATPRHHRDRHPAERQTSTPYPPAPHFGAAGGICFRVCRSLLSDQGVDEAFVPPRLRP